MNLDIQGIHNWRQSQTMWNVLNFARHDANILNPRTSNYRQTDNVRRYEFPIMQWCIGMTYKTLGENITITRLMVFAIGIFSILGIFFLIHHFTRSKPGALIGALLYQYSPLFYYYSVNPIPDILALSSSIWYCVFILKYIEQRRSKHIYLASIFILMATLAKLPYIMFSIISIVFFANHIFSPKGLRNSDVKFAVVQVIFILPAVIWYTWVIPTWNGNSVIKGVFNAETPWSEYKAIFNYHRKVMFPKIILNKYSWPFLFIGIFGLTSFKFHRKYIITILLINLVYLAFEFIPIGSIHDYYMMPFLISLYCIIGVGASYILKLSKHLTIPLLVVCGLAGIHTSNISTEKWSTKFNRSNPALFTHTSQLRNAVPQNEKCIILNDVSSHIFTYRIDKMGYVFSNDNLKIKWIEDMILNYDIQYMYSDSDKINNNPKFKKLVECTILSVGSLKVFKLLSKTDL